MADNGKSTSAGSSAKKKKTKKVVQKALAKAGLGKGTPMRQLLINHSAYFNSIMDPMNHSGAKIPDSCVVETATTQCIQRVQVAANAGGIAAVLLNAGRFNGSTDYWSSAAGSIITALTWTAQTKVYGPALVGVAARSRVVSAGLYASYQGTSLNNSGRMSVVFYPKTALISNANTLPPVAYSTDVAVAPYCATFPMSKGFGKALALPTDETSRSFTNAGTISVGNQTNEAGPGYVLVLCDGMVAAQIVEFTIVENYEFIPLTNSLNLLRPTPSKSDPIELSMVSNQISSDPWTAVRSDASEVARGSATKPITHGMAPSAAHPLQEKTFFEKLLSGVDSAIPVLEKGAKSVLDIGSRMAPLLM